MRIGVPREIHAGERRVATTPEVAAQLMEMGFSVAVEENAGAAASYANLTVETWSLTCNLRAVCITDPSIVC